MKPAACCDPLVRPCRDSELEQHLVCWPAGQPWPDLQPGQQLEIHGQPPYLSGPWTWSLWLDGLEDFDVGAYELRLEQAAQAGCKLILAAPLQASQHYRYRLYSLLRLLCDHYKMRFAIFEPRPLEAGDRLNHYLASQKRCCRRL
jgi:hypothetical protein